MSNLTTTPAAPVRVEASGINEKPQIVVTQLGARRHYLVPTALHARGMLARFYTDLYVGGTMAAVMSAASRVFPWGPLKRAGGRRDTGLPATKVQSFPSFALRTRWQVRRRRSRGEMTAHWLWAGRRFTDLVRRADTAAAAATYAYSSAALELFEAGRPRGRLCLLDHATAPKRFEDALTLQQSERYPGWASAPPSEDRWADDYADRQNQEAELADLIICGSTFVKQAVEQESGQRNKCAVVPLGLRHLPQAAEPKSSASRDKLRILFVGDDAIRKGIGDLWSAVRQFGTGHCDVRVAGKIDLSDHGRATAGECMSLLGHVPRSQMAGEYRWADVCVLPSISDTFGLVILEALAHGLPVITTPNTGGADVITDGRNGCIVPIMSPETIAERLEALHRDRPLLQAMSTAAIAGRDEFGLDRYGDRLVSTISAALRRITEHNLEDRAVAGM